MFTQLNYLETRSSHLHKHKGTTAYYEELENLMKIDFKYRSDSSIKAFENRTSFYLLLLYSYENA